jgi:Trypsin
MLSRSSLVAALGAVAALVVAAPALGAPASPRIIGGPVVPITAAPWQVYLVIDNTAACGGSILDATHVLTAAHCADGGGTHPVVAPTSIKVLAGWSDVSTYDPNGTPPAGTQVVDAASLRLHPYYDPHALSDDVMVLTLASALNLAGPNAKPIALAAPGSELAPGTPVRITGYGQSSPSTEIPDGKFRYLDMAAVSDDDCRNQLPGDSAVILCAAAPSGGACHGDSGGPLTTGNPAVQVAIASSANPTAGCAGIESFTDVASPEIRAFIDGAAAIPRAPRQQTVAQITSVSPPVNGSPLTCVPGTWDGSPAFTYTFQVDGVGVLQSGPVATYAPTLQDVGKPITCVIRAANAGGASTSRTGTTPPIARDTVRPASRLTFSKCSGRTCRFRLRAADSNSLGTVTVQSSASYRYRGRCKVRRKGKTRRVRCTKTKYRHATATQAAPGRYSVTFTKLAYRRTRFTFFATDAGGNRQRRALSKTLTVRRHRR